MVYKAHTWVDDSEPYIVAEHLNEMEAGIAAAGGMLSPRAQDTPDMTLAVTAGRAYVGSTLYEYAGGNTAAYSAPSANPYIALLSLQSGGSLNITYGAEAASPAAPVTPTDEIPICQVYIPVGATSIKNTSDGSNGYLYKDVRPFIGGGGISSDSFSESITFLTTDLAAGKSGSVASFIGGGHLTKIRLRADAKAGQLAAGYMVVNDGTGLAPADTSLAFDGRTGTWANGDYALVVQTGEIIKINDADPATSPIDITRGHMGTVAGYIDDNDEIVRLNNGFTLDIFYDSNKYPDQRIARIENIMTSKATTDAAIVSTNHYLELSGAMPNLYIGDRILIDDTADEEAIVQSPPRDVATAGYDYVVYTEDALAAHDSGKDVYKVCEISGIAIPYDPAGGTLYYTLYWREANLGGNIAVTLEVYGEGY